MKNTNPFRIVGDDAPDDGFAGRVLQTFLDGTGNANTRDAKTRDLADFAEFFARDELTPAVINQVIGLNSAGIIQTLTAYKAWGREQGRSPATINRRLASIRGLLRIANHLGAPCPDPVGLVTTEKGGAAYRDTDGPEIAEVAKMLASIDRSHAKGARDYALLLLFCTNALRKNEALGANVADFNGKRGRLRIRGKGQNNQQQTVSLDGDTTAAINEYLELRPDVLRPESPLFASCDRANVKSGAGLRLGGRGWEKVIAELGQRILGEKLHPHSIRHTAATAALMATGGDVTRVAGSHAP